MWTKILQIAILLWSLERYVNCECFLSFDIGKEPIIAKKLGYYKMFFTPKHPLMLNTDEELDVYCNKDLRVYKSDYDQNIIATRLMLRCKKNGYWNYRMSEINSYDDFSSNKMKINCDGGADGHLYESKRRLFNCKHTSLGLGTQLDKSQSFIKAGLCYDWNTLDLKYINYEAYQKKNVMISNMNPPYLPEFLYNQPYEITKNVNMPFNIGLNSITLDVKLDNVETYINFISDEDVVKNTNFERFNYDYTNLVQDAPMQEVLQNYQEMLKTFWWSPLRRGNWATFLSLLQQRIKVTKYILFTGTSGTVEIPSMANKCQSNETLGIFRSDGVRKTAPKYIWSYLKEIYSNDGEQFVVIGYNSPFNSNDAAAVQFCPDMCDEIQWLRSFAKVRQMATLGLVFCCRAADIANKLDNFPIVYLERPEHSQAISNSSLDNEQPADTDYAENTIQDSTFDNERPSDTDYEENIY